MKRILLLLLFSTTVIAATIDYSISWKHPIEREDNTKLTRGEIAGYKIYYGDTPGDYQNETFINDCFYALNINTVPAGVIQYGVIITVDTDGRESDYSDPFVIGTKDSYTWFDKMMYNLQSMFCSIKQY